MESDLRRCELRFLTSPRTDATERLGVKLVEPSGWVSLKTLKPPPPAVLPATSSELAKKFMRATGAGGSRGGSGCGGDLQLKEPTCGETIDVSTFTIRWNPVSSGGVAILVERADGEAARFRGTANDSEGEFSAANLTAFLRRIQQESDAVDITVRVMAEGGKNAVRLVRVPPSSRSNDYEDRVKALGTGGGVPTIVTRMSLALEESMWSRAAEEARTLIPLAVGTAPALEYAVVGICQSDFQEEKALLRKSLRGARYDELCSASAPSGAATPSAPLPQPAPEVGTGGNARTRTGIALLIGNYDYWNTPLNSVKGDLRSMSDALRSLGFAVTVKENLRNPRQFVDALDEVLEKSGATPDDVLLLYYSGHGIQLDGKAYLLSTGVSPNARVAEDVRDNAESAQALLEEMERAIPGTRVLIVEACRNDPLAPSPGSSMAAKGGFAFQQDDVPNTFVMFANKPGATTPVRSDYGLMGPFTDSLVYALQTSATGEILEVYDEASRKTREISPTQEPVIYHSKNVKPVVLKRETLVVKDARAKELLNDAEISYGARAWPEFNAAVTRAKALAADGQLQQRLSNESAFVQLVMRAEGAEKLSNWAEAATNWQKARDLFTAREWVGMRAAVAWLMADELSKAVRALSALGTQSDSELARQARQMTSDLTKEFPTLQSDADAAAAATQKTTGQAEFVKIQNEE